jgi:hypothetical protein
MSKNYPELIATCKFYSKSPIAPLPRPTQHQHQLDIKNEIKEKMKQQKNKLSMRTNMAKMKYHLILFLK